MTFPHPQRPAITGRAQLAGESDCGPMWWEHSQPERDCSPAALSQNMRPCGRRRDRERVGPCSTRQNKLACWEFAST